MYLQKPTIFFHLLRDLSLFMFFFYNEFPEGAAIDCNIGHEIIGVFFNFFLEDRNEFNRLQYLKENVYFGSDKYT